MNQEQMIKMQLIEQEVNQLNQHLQLIEQNINEMSELRESLEELKKPENKEILANIGKRIYLPVEIKDRKLIVEVGKGHYVKKTVSDTTEVVEDQMKNLISARTDINGRLGSMQEEVTKIIGDIEKEKEKEEKIDDKSKK